MTRKTVKKAKAGVDGQEPGVDGLTRAEWVASAIATAAMNPAAGKAGADDQRRRKSSKRDG